MHQIQEFFSKLFDSSDWPPRWHCGRWTDFHGWLYIISDLLIWSAYFTIPFVILKYISKKQDVKFIRVYFLFAAFILACGSTHLLDAVSFWLPAYRFNALMRVITGILSWITVFYLVKFLPVAFSLKSQKELETEVTQREKAEEKINLLNAKLEQRILERTNELFELNTEQKRVIQEMEVLSMIAKETSNSVIIFDKSTRHASWVNEGFTRHTGYTERDMHGKKPLSILRGAETDKHVLDMISGQIKKNLPYSCDLLIYTKSGETKWQFVSGQPIRGDNGAVAKYFVIATDISERKRMEEERLATKIEGQKQVTRIILETREIERNVLGRELHDNINQILASINLKLGYYLEEPENNIDVIKNCRENLQHAIQETRNLSHDMVMPRFSERSLKEELKLLIGNYSYKKVIQLELAGINESDISSTIKETLFRIAQEQLSNIAKHAKAGMIGMRLSNDARLVTMVIHDNGVGFDVQQQRKGIGITNILNRVEPYNGTAEIISMPGKGCTLLVTIPLAA